MLLRSRRGYRQVMPESSTVGRMGRPVRRVLSGGRGPLDGHLSRRHVAAPLQRSTRGLGEPRQHPLSDLAPGEVYRADRVTTIPVVSYTTLSPLPGPKPGRSALCGTVSRITPGGCYPPPCPVEPGRSSVRLPATRPSSRPIRTLESTGGGRQRIAWPELRGVRGGPNLPQHGGGQRPDPSVRTRMHPHSGHITTSSSAACRREWRSVPESTMRHASHVR